MTDPASEAQREYDNDPALRALLHEAMTSPRIQRARRRKPAPTSDSHALDGEEMHDE